jgi:hypothetical protein
MSDFSGSTFAQFPFDHNALREGVDVVNSPSPLEGAKPIQGPLMPTLDLEVDVNASTESWVITDEAHDALSVAPVINDSLLGIESISVGVSSLTDRLLGIAGDQALTTQDIVFIDAAVSDAESLLTNISPSTEVIRLNASTDGIEQITTALASRQNISGVHIVSHGSAGSVALGTANLSLDSLAQYQSHLQAWGNALTETGDVLFYGCNVAEGEIGQVFVAQLAQLIGADVAASDDLTGNTALGGDWMLEIEHGDINTTQLAFSNFSGILGGNIVIKDGKLEIRESRITPGNDSISLTYSNNKVNIQFSSSGIWFSEIPGVGFKQNSLAVDISKISELSIDLSAGKDTVTFQDWNLSDTNKKIDLSIDFGNNNPLQETFKTNGLFSTAGGKLSVKNADEVSFDSNVLLGGGNLTVENSDEVNINSNVLTGGGNFTIEKSGNSGGINITNNATISTRNISQNSISAHLDESTSRGNSIGNSGNISISAITKGDSSDLDASALRIGLGANLLTQASGSYQAGDITLKAQSNKNLTDILTDFGLGGTVHDANILLGENVSLKGKNITLQAEAGGKEADINLVEANAGGAGLRKLVDLLAGLPLAVKVIDADAKVDVGTGTQIISTGKVTIKSEATADSSLSVATSENGLFAPLSIGVSVADTTAETKIGSGVKISAFGDVDILSNGISKAVSKARTGRNLGQKPKDNQATAISIAVAYSDVNSHAIVSEEAIIQSEGNVNIHATGNSHNEAGSSAGIYEDGTAAFTIGVGVSDSDIKAEVNGKVEAKGKDLGTFNLDDAVFNPYKGYRDTGEGMISLGKDSIEFAEPHNLKNGDTLVYRKGSINNQEVGGLKDGATYHVIVIDPKTIRLSVKQSTDLKDSIGINASSKTGTGHSLRKPGTQGISILAKLDSIDVATTSSGILQDTLSNKILNFDTSALTAAARTSASFKESYQSSWLGKNKVSRWAGEKGFTEPGGNSGNSSAKWGLAGAFSLATSDHHVTSIVGSQAELLSEQDIEVRAKHQSLVEASASSELQELKPDEKGASQSTARNKENAISAAVSVGNYDSTVKTLIQNNASLDAKGNIDIKAEAVYPFALDTGTYEFSDIADIENQRQADQWLSNFLVGGLGVQLKPENPSTESENPPTKAQRLKPWNSWTKSSANGDKLGLAGAVNVVDYVNNVKTEIGSGVRINQSQNEKYRSENHKVFIEALTDMSLVNITGNPISPVGNSKGSGGIGGSIFIQDITNTTEAIVHDKAQIHTGVQGQFNLSALDDVNNFNLVYSGGSAGKFGVNAGVAINLYESSTIAKLSHLAQVSTGTVDITAVNDADFWNVTGGIAKSEAVGLGASVAVNDITRKTQAFVGNVEGSSTTQATTETINAAGDINIRANNDGNLITASLAGSIGTSSTGSSQGSSAGKYGLGVSGSVSINEIEDTTQAYIQNARVKTAQNLSVKADNNSNIVSMSGAASLSLDPTKKGGGLAGSYSNNDVSGNTRAYVTNSSLDLAGNLFLNTTLDQDITAVGMSGTISSSAAGGALAGQVMINDIQNQSYAYLDANSTVRQGKDVRIATRDESDIVAIAGAVSVDLGGKAGIGAALALNTINNTTKAYIDRSTLAKVDNLAVVAVNDAQIDSVAVAVGFSNGMAASVAYANNDITNTTEAYIANGASIATAGQTSVGIPDAVNGAEPQRLASGVAIIATNQAEIDNVAINASGSLGLSVAGNVSDNEIKNVTKAYLQGATLNSSQSVQVRGYSLADIDVKAGAVGIAGKGAVGASVDITDIANTTEVFVQRSNVTAGNDVDITSYTREQVDAVIVSGSASGAFSAAGNVELLTLQSKNTAYLDSSTIKAGRNLTVTADNIASIGENIEKSDDFNHKIKYESLSRNGVAVGSIAASLGGGIGGTVLITSIKNQTTAYMTDSETNAKETTQVNANSKELVSTLAGTGALGKYAGLAGTVILNTIETDTRAYIGKNSQSTEVTYESKNLKVTANNDAKINSISGALGGGAVGLGASVDVNNIGNTTEAFIGDGAKVRADHTIDVVASAEKSVNSTSVAFGGGIVSVQGAIAITNLGKTTLNEELEGTLRAKENQQQKDPNNQSQQLTESEKKALQQEKFNDNLSSQVTTVQTQRKQFDPNQTEQSRPSNSITAWLTALFSPKSGFSQSTKAYIGDNAVVSANTIQIKATDKTHLDVDPGVVGAGLASAGGAVGIINIRNDVQAYIGTGAQVDATSSLTLISDGQVLPQGKEDTILEARAAQAGGFALGGAVAKVNSSNNSRAYIGEQAKIAQNRNLSSLTVQANTLNQLRATTGGLSVGGIGAGMSNAEVYETGTTQAWVGRAAKLGTSNVYVDVQKLQIKAETNQTLEAESTALAGGIIAGSGAKSVASATPTVQAFVQDNAQVYTTTDTNIEARAKGNVVAEANGINVGAAAAGISQATTEWKPTITSQVGQSAAITSVLDDVSITAANQGERVKSIANAAAGGLLGGVGAETQTTVEANTTAQVNNSATITAKDDILIDAQSRNVTTSDAGGTSTGLAAVGSAKANADIDNTTRALTGDGVSLKSTVGNISILAKAHNQNDKTYAEAGTGGIFAKGGTEAKSSLKNTVDAVLGASSNARADGDKTGTVNIRAINTGNIKADAEQTTNLALADLSNMVTSSVDVQSDIKALVGISSNIDAKNLNLLTQTDGFEVTANARAKSTSAVSDVTARANINKANFRADSVVENGANIDAQNAVRIESLQNNIDSIARSNSDSTGIGSDEAHTKNYLTVESFATTQSKATIARGNQFTANAEAENGKYVQDPQDYDTFSGNDEFREGRDLRQSRENIWHTNDPLPMHIVVTTLSDHDNARYRRNNTDGERETLLEVIKKDGVSLREAIRAVGSGGTISFADNLFSSHSYSDKSATIRLNQGELHINSSLTIDAGSGRRVKLQGNDKYNRVLKIDDGSNATSSVFLQGLDIRDGRTSGYGGGIYNTENLSLTGVVIANNYADRSGGGIYTKDGNITIVNSTISGNRTYILSPFSNGGGIAKISGDLTMIDSQVTKNIAAAGGGLYLSRGDDIITNVTFLENIAVDGGAISNQDSNTLNISGTSSKNIFESNKAATSGGGISNGNGFINIQNARFTNNSVEKGSGGAIATFINQGSSKGAAKAAISIINSTFTSNRAEIGGAVYQNGANSPLNTVNITDSELYRNNARRGGAIYLEKGRLELDENRISSNRAEVDGGAIYQKDGNFSLENSRLANNVSEWGGGFFQESGVANINESKFSGNRSDLGSNQNGGAILFRNGVLNIQRSEFSENVADRGAVIHHGHGTLNIESSAFISNKADIDGGALFQEGGHLTLVNSTVSSNVAQWGGGLYQNGGTSNIVSSTFTYNRATKVHGGIWLMSDGRTTLTNSIVANSTGTDVKVDNGKNFSTIGTNIIERLEGASARGIISSDPQLSYSPGYNGGPTRTHFLYSNSPAIDASDVRIATDQRGYARPSGRKYDIGAYEAGSRTAPEITHFDLSNQLNIDVVVNYAEGQTDTTQSTVDNAGYALITQSFAVKEKGSSGDGLPDDGQFSVPFHPDISLSYNNSDNGDNARMIQGRGEFTFTVPQKAYHDIYLGLFSTHGQSDIVLRFNYSDGTRQTTSVRAIPDWVESINESSDLFYLVDGLDRSKYNGSGYDDNNGVAIFGAKFAPNPARTLTSITVRKTSSSGNLVFLGATGVSS